MKRTVIIVLCMLVIISMSTVSVFADIGTNASLFVTEVAVQPAGDNKWGQLVELHNNSRDKLDLYDYEFNIGISRDKSFAVRLSPEKCEGGFYATDLKGAYVMDSGETAVMWLLTDMCELKNEDELRAKMDEKGTPIPSDVRIFAIDLSDPALCVGTLHQLKHESVCYLMCNYRGAFDSSGYDDELQGAFVRIYGQAGVGRSQSYGPTDPELETGSSGRTYDTALWQLDLTANSADEAEQLNEKLTIGTLNDRQSDMFYIPAPVPVVNTEETPVENTAEDPAKDPTEIPTETPAETSNVTPAETSAAASENTPKVTAPQTSDAFIIFAFFIPTAAAAALSFNKKKIR